MSLTVVSTIGTVIAAGLTMSMTRSLPWTGAVILGGIWAYPKVEEYEQNQLKHRLATDVFPAPIAPIQVAAPTAEAQAISGVVNHFNPVLNVGLPTLPSTPPVTENLNPAPDFHIDIDQYRQSAPKKPEPISVQSPLEDKLQWLEDMLENDGAIGLLSLVAATPLRVIGPQRSGKSTFVKSLALLRQLYIPEHTVEAWSPDEEPWPDSFELYSTYQDMASRMRAFCNRVEQGKRANQTTIMDEFGSYAANGINGDLMEKAVKLSTMRAAKNGELVIFVLHGATAAYLGDVTGLQTSLQTYKTIFLDTKEDRLGNRSPGDTFRIVNDGQTATITRPPWLKPEFLLKAFPELHES
jgi:hypothetical protein